MSPKSPTPIDRVCHGLEMLIALCLAVMVVMVFGNVVLRYGFNSGIAVSEEVSRWLFVWMTFLGAIVALKEHGHLGSDMLVSRLPVVGKKVCLVVGQALMLYVTWLIFWGALAQVKINWDVEAPVTGASMAIVYSSGVVFSLCAAVLLLRDIWRALSGRLGKADLVMVKESEESAELESLQAELERDHADIPAHMRTHERTDEKTPGGKQP